MGSVDGGDIDDDYTYPEDEAGGSTVYTTQNNRGDYDDEPSDYAASEAGNGCGGDAPCATPDGGSSSGAHGVGTGASHTNSQGHRRNPPGSGIAQPNFSSAPDVLTPRNPRHKGKGKRPVKHTPSAGGNHGKASARDKENRKRKRHKKDKRHKKGGGADHGDESHSHKATLGAALSPR